MTDDDIEPIREHFRQALQNLCDPDFSTRGDERPTLEDLGAAYDAAESAAEALKVLLSPPNPYADKALRPGLHTEPELPLEEGITDG